MIDCEGIFFMKVQKINNKQALKTEGNKYAVQ